MRTFSQEVQAVFKAWGQTKPQFKTKSEFKEFVNAHISEKYSEEMLDDLYGEIGQEIYLYHIRARW